MAEPLPPPLKIPEVSRFINRANQLRTFKPAIAYWCEYHAVNQIVGKSLHTTDDACFNFTRALIDRLETTKTERVDDDAIVDNTAGQAYVEQFAQETFTRAERTMGANKVTRQTADTFDAAATFFDLTSEWGDLDAETKQKIRFAKWNAARILKAIREGRDPNESNPKVQEEEADPSLDAEMAAMLGEDKAGVAQDDDAPSAPRPVSVEDAPDVEPLPSAPSVPAAPTHQDEYFPSAPSASAGETFAPSPPSIDASPMGAVPPPLDIGAPPLTSGSQIPPQPSPQIPTKLPAEYTPSLDMPPPLVPRAGAAASPATDFYNNAAPPPPAPAPAHPAVQARGTLPTGVQHPLAPGIAGPPAAAAVPTAQPPVAAPSQPGVAPTQKELNQAQKHAKWAISAINFEDVPTAIMELQNALAVLGAR